MRNRSRLAAHTVSAVLSVVSAGGLCAADFPSIDRLPAQPELPDPLVMLNGDRVTTRQQWESKRRPELKELFQHYMYGYLADSSSQIEKKINNFRIILFFRSLAIVTEWRTE